VGGFSVPVAASPFVSSCGGWGASSYFRGQDGMVPVALYAEFGDMHVYDKNINLGDN